MLDNYKVVSRKGRSFLVEILGLPSASLSLYFLTVNKTYS